MKVIAFQYLQLLVSASDAGQNKIPLHSITLAYYSLRPLPVTAASQAQLISLARSVPQKKNGAAYSVRMASLYREVVLKEKVQSEVVGVEKLFLTKSAQIKLRQDAL